MSDRKPGRRRPSLSLVLSMLAVVLAMSGTAYAVQKAPKNSVVSSSIKNGQVRTADVAKGAVSSPKLKDGAVTRKKLRPGAVTGDQVLDGSIRSADLAPDAVGAEALSGVVQVSTSSPPLADGDLSTNAGDHGLVDVTSYCPDGGVAISGGAYWSGATSAGKELENNYIHSSHRYGLNGWRVRGINDMGAQGTVRLTVVVYCLMPTQPPAS